MAEAVATSLNKKLDNLWNQIQKKKKSGLMSGRKEDTSEEGSFYR